MYAQIFGIAKEVAKQFKKLMKKDHESNATYALDTGWFLQWRCYITNDLSDTYYMNTIKKISENRLIGVLPPRYISNGNIAEKSTEHNGTLLLYGCGIPS